MDSILQIGKALLELTLELILGLWNRCRWVDAEMGHGFNFFFTHQNPMAEVI